MTMMYQLHNKTVVVGVTGGIAAYKAAELVRSLKKSGAQVHVMMTKSACEFVTPLTFQTLSQNFVVSDMFEQPHTWEVEHISLAKRADAVLICPATANCIGKLAAGIADDFLTTTVMATTAPVLLAASMNDQMYANSIVQENIQKLKAHGYQLIEPETGELACGTSGKGRLASLDSILEATAYAVTKKDLAGLRILITAGPTQEAADPVRYLTNHSSGKMGYAIARAAAARGALVTLVSGPTALCPPYGVACIPVTTAQDMYDAVLSRIDDCDAVIKAAAVADFRPKSVSEEKIKKSAGFVLELEQNPDILAALGERKSHQTLIGFCMETENLLSNAAKKLQEKHLDYIVANDLTTEGAGFQADTNVITILGRDGSKKAFPKAEKEKLADIILDCCLAR